MLVRIPVQKKNVSRVFLSFNLDFDNKMYRDICDVTATKKTIYYISISFGIS